MLWARMVISGALSGCAMVSGLDDFRASSGAGGSAAGGADGGSATGGDGLEGGTSGTGGSGGYGDCDPHAGVLGACDGTGVQACYLFEGDLADSGPNGLDLVDATGTPATFITAGASGSAVHLDGAALMTPTSASLTTSVMSVGVWIRLESTPPGGNRRGVIDHQEGYSMFVHSDGHLSGTATGMTGAMESAPALLTVGAWHHVALTADGTTGYLYVDGTEVASRAQAAPAPADDFMAIGANHDGNGNLDELFRGDIDTVVVRNIFATRAEICGQ